MRKTAALLLAATVVLGGCSSAAPSTPSTSSADTASSSENVEEASNTLSRTSATADTVFGYPTQYEVKSGSGSDIGTVAVFSASSSDCTVENLELWCNQYVRWEADNWCVIEYTDKPGLGVYANATLIIVDARIADDYSLEGDEGSKMYVFEAEDVIVDGSLKPVGQ